MTDSATRTAIVVPCYNEAARLRPRVLGELADVVACDVIAVDDGSTDATAALLTTVAGDDERVSTLRLPRNRGKGEAVRQGLLAAVALGYQVVGYCDADFATPPAEMARLATACAAGHVVVLGSRVGLLGHEIDRSLGRHYAGRVFATFSSIVLGFQVYDTQCGAKMFRSGAALEAAIASPFTSRWAFDVELLGRLAHSHRSVEQFLEVPLDRWHDVVGSKLSFGASLRSTADLALIRRSLAHYRRTR